MHASSVVAPTAAARRSTSTWVLGEIVAQLMKRFPWAWESKRVARFRKNTELRRVIRHHRENHVGRCCNGRERRGMSGAEFAREFLRRRRVHIVHRRNVIAALLETARHVGAHSTDSDESNFFRHKGEELCTR